MGFMDDLNDMFNKSAAAAGDMLNKGASAAGRMADSANLRFKQGEIDRRWKDACAALGESVIEAVKADPALLSGREQMMADQSPKNEPMSPTNCSASQRKQKLPVVQDE